MPRMPLRAASPSSLTKQPLLSVLGAQLPFVGLQQGGCSGSR